MDKRLEILDLPQEVRDLVADCELTGKRTIFQRYGRNVAMLVSHDEYLALRETIDIANDPAIRARVAALDEATRRGAILAPEDLLGERVGNDRLRFAEPVEADWQELVESERTLVRNALVTIDEDPIIGAPLFEPLRGEWSYRVNHLRIVYRIVAEARFLVIAWVGRVTQ
jgi:mRNA-degrading endonuclease RelE of RelBE toxin-antitoxin system/PHD/YefM family antitoxin component YafN of YafNO toxin-antitoxin module